MSQSRHNLDLNPPTPDLGGVDYEVNNTLLSEADLAAYDYATQIREESIVGVIILLQILKPIKIFGR